MPVRERPGSMRGSLLRFWFTVDLRSLGLFRMLLGLLLLVDWGGRYGNLDAFYTDTGILPLGTLRQGLASEAPLSLLYVVTSPAGIRLFFAAGALSALLLLAGIGGRVPAILSAILYSSVLARNPLVNHGGDMVRMAMLVWLAFLPATARFSADAWRRRRSPPATRSPTSVAALAIVLQIGLVYLFSALAKSGPTWSDGTALHYALNIDVCTSPLGRRLAEAPLWITRTITWATLALEYAVLPLILCPLGQPLLRRIAIAGLVGLHTGIWVAMDIGDFPAVMMCTFVLLLGPADWDLLRRVARRRTPGERAPTQPLRKERDGMARLLRALANGLAVILVASVVLSGYDAVVAPRLGTVPRTPGPVHRLVAALQLQQDWHLFAPDPYRGDGWWVLEGTTASGEMIDLLTGRALTWEKPRRPERRFDRYWRKWLLYVWRDRYEIYRDALLDHWATRGCGTGSSGRFFRPGRDPIIYIRAWYVLEATQPPGYPHPYPVDRRLVGERECPCEKDAQGARR